MSVRCVPSFVLAALLTVLLPLAAVGQSVSPAAGPRVRALAVRDGDIRDVLRMISAQTGVNIVADDTVRGTVTVNLNDVTVHQALETLLAVKGLYSLQTAPNIYLISTKPLGLALKIKLSDDRRRLTLECKEVELKDLLKELGPALNKTLIPDPSVTGKATLQIGDVPVDEALSLIAVAHGLSIAKTQSAYVFQKFDAARPQRPLPFAGAPTPQVGLDVVNANLEECLQALAAQSGVNILPLAPMQDKVSVRFANLNLEEALKLVLSGTKYTYRKVDNYAGRAGTRIGKAGENGGVGERENGSGHGANGGMGERENGGGSASGSPTHPLTHSPTHPLTHSSLPTWAATARSPWSWPRRWTTSPGSPRRACRRSAAAAPRPRCACGTARRSCWAG